MPFVSATAALIFSRHPEFTADQVRQIIRNTANGDGWNPYTGHGILDAAAALRHDEAVPDIVLRPEDVTVTHVNACYENPGATVRVDVAVRNEGPIDCDKALLALYDGIPGEGGYMPAYHYTQVRGLEQTVVSFEVDLSDGEHTLCALADPFGKLPAAKRSRGEIYAKAWRQYTVM